MKENETILLFDGVCNLCSNSVQFVLKRNTKENIKFASLQSEFGKSIIYNTEGLPSNYTGSLVTVKNDLVYLRSDAALQIAKELHGFWKLLAFFLLVPKFLRDPIYDFIARNRYRWFGKSQTCWVPEPKWSNRFLD